MPTKESMPGIESKTVVAQEPTYFAPAAERTESEIVVAMPAEEAPCKGRW